MNRRLPIGLFVLSLACIAPGVFLHPDDRAGRLRSAGEGGEARGAMEFWAASRAYPGAEMPADGYIRAFQEFRAMLSPLPKHGTSLDAWRSLGPTNVGGRTLALAINPKNPAVLYAGSASGGLWRSRSGGEGAAGWERVETGFPALGVGAIAIVPEDTATMYIATGEVYGYRRATGGLVDRTTRGSYGIGILKTTDAGRTWAMALDWSYDSRRGVQDLALDPADSRVVWAATTEGTYKSLDAGATWNRVHDVPMAMQIAIDPQQPSRVYVACGNFKDAGSGVYRTTDGGSTWTHLLDGFPQGFAGKISIAIAPSAPAILYACVGTADGVFSGTALCRSSNHGDTWSIVSTEDVANYQGWYSHAVTVKADDPASVLCVGIDAWKSTSAGAALRKTSDWRKATFGLIEAGESEGPTNYVHADIHCIVRHPTNPDVCYFGTDGGVFRTRDFGETYRSLNGGYQTSQFYNGFSSARDLPAFCIGGLQDNATVFTSGSSSWLRAIGGDGAMTAVNGNDRNILYGSTQYGYHYRSTDGGASFETILDGDINASFVAPLAMSASNPRVLYAGTTFVLRTTDGGDVWETMNGGARLDGNPTLACAVSNMSSDTLYISTAPVQTRGHVFASFDGGSTFRDVTRALPDRYCVDLAVDPADARVAYAVCSGFGTGHVFRTSDAGATWTGIGAGLPDIPTSAIAVDPDHRNHLFVGNDFGVFVSYDGGANWSPLMEGLPAAVQVMDLAVAPQGRLLRVATHGNGVYERPLPESPVVGMRAPAAVDDFEIRTVFPQPATARVVLDVRAPSRTEVDVRVIAMDGRVMLERHAALGQGGTAIRINTAALPAGAYVVSVTDGRCVRAAGIRVVR